MEKATFYFAMPLIEMGMSTPQVLKVTMTPLKDGMGGYANPLFTREIFDKIVEYYSEMKNLILKKILNI